MRYISEYTTFPEAAAGNGYWVHGNDVYDMTTDIHVKFIEENPKLFDITSEMVKKIYDKHHEKIGSEGEAREELIKLVANNGWLRVRHYERPDYWSIQCDSTRLRDHTIENFIYWAIEHKVMRYDSSATITGYNDPDDVHTYEWKDGGIKGFLIHESIGNRKESASSYFFNLIEKECVFNEESLSRVMEYKKYFIVSASKQEASKEEDLTNSIALRKMIKEKGLKFFELVGYFDEEKKIKSSYIPYIEIAYYVPYLSTMPITKFEEIREELYRVFEQDEKRTFVPQGVRRWESPENYIKAEAMGYILKENTYFIEKELQEKYLLTESSWSRIIQHIEKGDSFAIISAFLKNRDREVNLVDHEKLRKQIRTLGYGYIEQYSGYSYKDDNTGKNTINHEMSFFIPKISFDEAIKLGSDYYQESILFKDDGGFKLIFTKNENNHKIGDVDMTFKIDRKPDGQITFDPEVLKYAFSQLKKGSVNQTSKQFAYIPECIYIKEGHAPSWGEAMAYANKKEMLHVKMLRIA
jgi:hypothetical protein